MNRRNFLQTAAAISAASLLPRTAMAAPDKRINRIGVQLFSLPKLLEKDFPGTLRMLSRMGYREVELFGPYPFSAASAQESWRGLASALGFSGSGFFGHTVQEVKAILAQHNLSAPSMHTDLDTLQTRMGELGEAARVLGSTYVTLPAIPDGERRTLDDYKRLADAFNTIGEQAKKAGVRFAYHNHGYGLQETNGQIPLNIILDGTDPQLVFFEMDIYWTTAGGADPVAYLEAYPNRYHLMHIKDMTKPVRFSGDGGDASQWMELFPFMTEAGSGVLDLKTILTKAQRSGVRHFFVEQDLVADPEQSLPKSIRYLSSV